MKEMTLTEIQIVPLKPRNGLVAFASITYNNQLSLNSIAIYTRPNGDFRLVYPTKTLPNGKILSLFYPINQKTGRIITEAVIEKFRKLIEKVEKTKGERNEQICTSPS
jgi:stage V sporulation protein G